MGTPSKVKPSLGRYNLSGSREPPNGRGQSAAPARNLNARTALVAIRDPDPSDEAGFERLQATVRRGDVLEDELAADRITDAQYLVGREIQRAYERARRGPAGPSVWRLGTRVDSQDRDQEVARWEANEALQAVRMQIKEAIGSSGVAFLERFLVDGITFARYAADRGLNSKRGTASIAGYFRMQLEKVTDGWGQKPNDKAKMRNWRA